jgi:hypothetical protein
MRELDPAEDTTMYATYQSQAHRNLAILLGQRQRISAALQATRQRDSLLPAPVCPELARYYAHALTIVMDQIEAIPDWASLQADLAEV